MSKYSELYPRSLAGDGLISELMREFAEINHFGYLATPLELAYFNRSGSKEVTKQFEAISEEDRVIFLRAMFYDKWNRLYKAYKLEYSPLETYTIKESGSDSRELSRDGETTFGRVVDETGSDTGTVGNTASVDNSGTVNNTGTVDTNAVVNKVGTDTSTNDSGIFGFNSTEDVPSETGKGTDTTQSEETTQNNEETQSTETSQSTETKQSTETRDLAIERKTTNSGEDTFSRKDSEESSYQTTKSGNLGYRSPSELVREEFATWAAPFFDIVFADVDSAIMLKIYA